MLSYEGFMEKICARGVGEEEGGQGLPTIS